MKQKQEKTCYRVSWVIIHLLRKLYHIVLISRKFWKPYVCKQHQLFALKWFCFFIWALTLSLLSIYLKLQCFTHTFFSARCKSRLDSLTINSSSVHIACLPQTATIPATIAASRSSSWTAAQMEGYQRNRRICWMTPLRRTQMWWEAIHCLNKVCMTMFLSY